MTGVFKPDDFAWQGPDPLRVLASTAAVAKQAAQVRIDPEAIARFARGQAGQPAPQPAEDALHCAFLPPRRRLNYLLVLEALNFCFWDDAPRWEVPWQGARFDGYWALAAALRRAIREDALPLWDAHWLAGLEMAGLETLLRGEGRPPPLMAERLAHLREAGSVLLREWRGDFANLVEAAGGQAARLAELVAENFPSFRDEAQYRGRTVRFYKRAQICAADLARLLADHPLGRLEGLDTLTAFADYKVPQVLRARGILVYGGALAARIDALQEIPAGSEAEVEIRGATVWACEWLAHALTEAGGTGAAPFTAARVDALLWAIGQDKTGLAPYHRTRTIYY